MRWSVRRHDPAREKRWKNWGPLELASELARPDLFSELTLRLWDVCTEVGLCAYACFCLNNIVLSSTYLL